MEFHGTIGVIEIQKLYVRNNPMEFCAISSDTVSCKVIKQQNLFVNHFLLSDSK